MVRYQPYKGELTLICLVLRGRTTPPVDHPGLLVLVEILRVHELLDLGLTLSVLARPHIKDLQTAVIMLDDSKVLTEGSRL